MLKLARQDFAGLTIAEQKVKHQMTRILLSLSQNGFFGEKMAEQWNRVATHLVDDFADHKFDAASSYESHPLGYEPRVQSAQLLSTVFDGIKKQEFWKQLEVQTEARLLLYDLDFRLELASPKLPDQQPDVIFLEYDGWHHFSRKKQRYQLKDKINRLQILNSGAKLCVLSIRDPRPVEKQLLEILDKWKASLQSQSNPQRFPSPKNSN